jgi:hypothetical protein
MRNSLVSATNEHYEPRIVRTKLSYTNNKKMIFNVNKNKKYMDNIICYEVLLPDSAKFLASIALRKRQNSHSSLYGTGGSGHLYPAL